MINDENTIPLKRAQEWAKKWRENPENTSLAFLIPNIDVTQLLAHTDVENIRAYNGTDEEGVHRLMIVGVDADGNDLIDSEKGHYIYDFTTPCPNLCSLKSPLYTL